MNQNEPQLARCRVCDRNDIPVENMAIYSWKISFGGFTGVCAKCINDDHAWVGYNNRIDANRRERGEL